MGTMNNKVKYIINKKDCGNNRESVLYAIFNDKPSLILQKQYVSHTQAGRWRT